MRIDARSLSLPFWFRTIAALSGLFLLGSLLFNVWTGPFQRGLASYCAACLTIVSQFPDSEAVLNGKPIDKISRISIGIAVLLFALGIAMLIAVGVVFIT